MNNFNRQRLLHMFAFTLLSIVFVFVLLGFLAPLTGCYETPSGTYSDKITTQAVANNLQAKQPTPADINYSLERYNLIRRAYWVNGQREKANTLVCEVEKPLGYVVLFTESGGVVGRFVVDGKVSSLNSYLTPDSEYYERRSDGGELRIMNNEWLADVDGSYGENDNGIFFFTPDGRYIEWTGTYLYSDIPFEVNNPIINIGGNE